MIWKAFASRDTRSCAATAMVMGYPAITASKVGSPLPGPSKAITPSTSSRQSGRCGQGLRSASQGDHSLLTERSTARTVDGYHRWPPWAVGTRS